MTTREKIIVAMAGAALLFGIYNTLSEPDVPELAIKEASASTILTVKNVLKNEPVDTKAINLTLNDAQLPWQEAAFLSAGEGFVTERDQISMRDIPAGAMKLVYSGFLEMAGEQIAIINDVEYRVGETVEEFMVEKISPMQIRLSHDNKSFELMIREKK